MKLFFLFLFASFFMGGTRIGHRAMRHPVVIFAVCAVVGAMFYSYRVVR